MESSRISGNGCLAKICLIEGSIFRPNDVAEMLLQPQVLPFLFPDSICFFYSSSRFAAEKVAMCTLRQANAFERREENAFDGLVEQIGGRYSWVTPRV